MAYILSLAPKLLNKEQLDYCKKIAQNDEGKEIENYINIFTIALMETEHSCGECYASNKEKLLDSSNEILPRIFSDIDFDLIIKKELP